MLLVDPSTQPIFPRISSTDGPDDDDDYSIELADWATPRRINDSIGKLGILFVSPWFQSITDI